MSAIIFMINKSIKIKGMSCAACAARIEKVLGKWMVYQKLMLIWQLKN